MTLFLTLHAVLVIVFHFSGAPRGQRLLSPFFAYVNLIGHNHVYSLFRVPERPLSQNFSLIAQISQNERKSFGVLLPGLKDLGKGSFRERKLFAALTLSEQPFVLEFLRDYAFRACQAIRSETNSEPLFVSLERHFVRQDLVGDSLSRPEPCF